MLHVGSLNQSSYKSCPDAPPSVLVPLDAPHTEQTDSTTFPSVQVASLTVWSTKVWVCGASVGVGVDAVVCSFDSDALLFPADSDTSVVLDVAVASGVAVAFAVSFATGVTVGAAVAFGVAVAVAVAFGVAVAVAVALGVAVAFAADVAAGIAVALGAAVASDAAADVSAAPDAAVAVAVALGVAVAFAAAGDGLA